MILHHVWSIFIQLHSGRSYGMSANPLSYGDILDFQKATGINLSSYEIEIIKALDMKYLGSSNGK